MISAGKSVALMICSIVLSAIAQLAMKAGMVYLSAMNTGGHGPVLDILYNPAALAGVITGLGCYAVSLLCWMAAITRLELSLAYPMLSLSYVIVYVTAINWPLLHEQASLQRSLGIAIVIAGVILIARSGGGPADIKQFDGNTDAETDRR